MTILLLRSPITFSVPLVSWSSLSSSSSSSSGKWESRVAARDRVISFGRHKGRMLGSLPSKYLTWISGNLRAGESLQWAELADEVLADPIYRDRIEWESAQLILNGDRIDSISSSSPVSRLLQISSRFGWDNEDKAAWARIDFDLLGTSTGGRIPRIGGDKANAIATTMKKKKKTDSVSTYGGEGGGGGGRRGERRERRRRRKARIMVREQVQPRMENHASGKPVNPFPGRGALLEKIKLGEEEASDIWG